MHHPDALPQDNARRWPARHGCPVSRFRHLEVVHASDVLDNAVAGIVPDVHAKGEVRLGFHGQVRLDSSWPAAIYTPAMLLRRVAFPDRLPRFVFGMAVLATLLVAAPAAHSACRSPKNICKHFDDCLQRTSDPNNNDADGIRAGIKARNGQSVLAGAEACARDLGK
jgi:hypothetical protein